MTETSRSRGDAPRSVDRLESAEERKNKRRFGSFVLSVMDKFGRQQKKTETISLAREKQDKARLERERDEALEKAARLERERDEALEREAAANNRLDEMQSQMDDLTAQLSNASTRVDSIEENVEKLNASLRAREIADDVLSGESPHTKTETAAKAEQSEGPNDKKPAESDAHDTKVEAVQREQDSSESSYAEQMRPIIYDRLEQEYYEQSGGDLAFAESEATKATSNVNTDSSDDGSVYSTESEGYQSSGLSSHVDSDTIAKMKDVESPESDGKTASSKAYEELLEKHGGDVKAVMQEAVHKVMKDTAPGANKPSAPETSAAESAFTEVQAKTVESSGDGNTITEAEKSAGTEHVEFTGEVEKKLDDGFEHSVVDVTDEFKGEGKKTDKNKNYRGRGKNALKLARAYNEALANDDQEALKICRKKMKAAVDYLNYHSRAAEGGPGVFYFYREDEEGKKVLSKFTISAEGENGKAAAEVSNESMENHLIAAALAGEIAISKSTMKDIFRSRKMDFDKLQALDAIKGNAANVDGDNKEIEEFERGIKQSLAENGRLTDEQMAKLDEMYPDRMHYIRTDSDGNKKLEFIGILGQYAGENIKDVPVEYMESMIALAIKNKTIDKEAAQDLFHRYAPDSELYRNIFHPDDPIKQHTDKLDTSNTGDDEIDSFIDRLKAEREVTKRSRINRVLRRFGLDSFSRAQRKLDKKNGYTDVPGYKELVEIQRSFDPAGKTDKEIREWKNSTFMPAAHAFIAAYGARHREEFNGLADDKKDSFIASMTAKLTSRFNVSNEDIANSRLFPDQPVPTKVEIDKVLGDITDQKINLAEVDKRRFTPRRMLAAIALVAAGAGIIGGIGHLNGSGESAEALQPTTTHSVEAGSNVASINAFDDTLTLTQAERIAKDAAPEVEAGSYEVRTYTAENLPKPDNKQWYGVKFTPSSYASAIDTSGAPESIYDQLMDRIESSPELIADYASTKLPADVLAKYNWNGNVNDFADYLKGNDQARLEVLNIVSQDMADAEVSLGTVSGVLMDQGLLVDNTGDGTITRGDVNVGDNVQVIILKSNDGTQISYLARCMNRIEMMAPEAPVTTTTTTTESPAPHSETPTPNHEKPTPEPEKPTPEPEKPTPEPEKPTPEPEKPTPEPEKPDQSTPPPTTTTTIPKVLSEQNIQQESPNVAVNEAQGDVNNPGGVTEQQSFENQPAPVQESAPTQESVEHEADVAEAVTATGTDANGNTVSVTDQGTNTGMVGR